MPTVFVNTFEGQTIGAAATNSNSATSGAGVAFNRGTGSTTTYSGAHPAHGSVCLLLASAASQACSAAVAFTPTTSVSTARGFYLEAYPTADLRFLSANGCVIYLTSTGQVKINNAAGATIVTSTVVCPLNTQLRMEQIVIPNPSTTGGTIKVRVSVGDQIDPIVGLDYAFTAHNAGTGTVADTVFGRGSALTAGAFNDFLDDMRYSPGEVNFLGPMSINSIPVANAGPDQANINGGALVTLDGSASYDLNGSIAAYAWTQSSGPAVTLSDAGAAQPTFTAPVSAGAATLVFSLVVTDNQGSLSPADTVSVGVKASGSPIVLVNNFEGQVDGAAATNTNSAVSGFALGFNRGTGSTTVYTSAHRAHGALGLKLASANAASCSANINVTPSTSAWVSEYFWIGGWPTATLDLIAAGSVHAYLNADGTVTVNNFAGAAVFTSTATVPVGAQYRAELVVIPNASTTAGTIIFAIFAGDVTAPIFGLSYNATGTVNAGTANLSTISYGRSVPGSAQAFDLYLDDLRYALNATSLQGPVSSNILPTANAGADRSSLEPFFPMTLQGSGTDPDGGIAAYAWTQTSGPSAGLANPGTATPTVTVPGVVAAATLTFSLVVTDFDNGNSSPDTVDVGVLPATERITQGGVARAVKMGLVTAT